MKTQTRHSLMLMLCAFIWGTAFVAQSAGSGMGAYSFLAGRSWLAVLVLIPTVFAFDAMRKKQGQPYGWPKEKSERKTLLEQQINVIQSEINNIDAQIAKYDELISQKEDELAQLEQQEAEQYQLFCERVRYMEEEGEVSYWAILFNAEDFSDMLDRFMMVEEIMAYDNAIMDELLATQAQIEQEKAELEEARTAQEEARQKQADAKARLKSQQAEVDALISQISSCLLYTSDAADE